VALATGAQGMSKEDNDRRKAKRFKVQEGALAALKPYLACHNPIGTIIDVSERGLSFSCVATGQKANELSELDVCLKNDGFYLGKIPFKTVSDFDVHEPDALGFVGLRRRCVKFGDLTQKQTSQLEDFIQKYTV
jgi:hypothetical protein